MDRANEFIPELENSTHKYILPVEPWARRACSVFTNQHVQNVVGCSHTILTWLQECGCLASVRSPLDRRGAVDELYHRSLTDWARKAQGDVNRYPEEAFLRFTTKFTAGLCK